MTKIEALRLELAARELVEGTGLEWWEVVRIIDLTKDYKIVLGHAYKFTAELKDYELALRVLENKPVWEGDTLYFPDGIPITVRKSTLLCKKDGGLFDLSWNPPKPKTVMVELLVEDAKAYAGVCNDSGAYLRVAEACRKALENQK